MAALADKVQCSSRTIERIEGGMACYPTTLAAIAMHLGLGETCEQLMADESKILPNSERLTVLREAKQWTQSQLAEKSGCSDKVIADAENNCPISESQLQSIAREFDQQSADLSCENQIVKMEEDNIKAFSFPEFSNSLLKEWEAFLGNVSKMHKKTGHATAIKEAIIALNLAAVHTIGYASRISHSNACRDHDKEMTLAEEWFSIGKILLTVTEDKDLIISRLFLKARYWAFIDYWSNEDIENAGIRLLPLIKETEELIDCLES